MPQHAPMPESDEELERELAEQGWSDSAIEHLIEIHHQLGSSQ